MKYKKLALVLFSGFILQTNVMAKQPEKKETKSELKCHVELVGGRDIIHFAKVPTKKVSSIAHVLTGTKIKTGFSKKQQTIYKVNECVGLNDKFITGVAKQRDEDTAR